MSDNTIEQIMRLKAALERTPDASDSEEDEEIVAHTNRGHKLERGARFVSARTLNVPLPPSPESLGGVANEDSDLHIDVEHLLQPISDPAEVPNNAVIAQIFKSPHMQQLANDLLDRLVEDRAMLAKITKLVEATMGDDDSQLMPQIMDRVEHPNPYQSSVSNGRTSLQNGGTHDVLAEPSDPRTFFEIPELEVDRNLGLEPEAADVLRQRLLVVHQRMYEYVRCIDQIRSDLTTSMRLRRNVMNWCREINGDDYVKIDLDEQNGYDNAGLGEKPAKDYYRLQSPQDGSQVNAEYEQ